MGKGIFITGTDTGVGKTIIAGCLAKSLMDLSFKVAVYKPVESGCATKNDSDLCVIQKISGLTDNELFSSYSFKAKSSPHLAAEIEEVKMDMSLIKQKYSQLIKDYDYVLVEGAGGLIVPILRDYTIINLIKDLNIPAIIVARSGLGTINHTSLTVELLKQNDITLLGAVFNFYKGSFLEEDNKKVIGVLNNISILGCLPYYNKLDKIKIQNEFKKNINLKEIINFAPEKQKIEINR